jgi:hypothetical protein
MPILTIGAVDFGEGFLTLENRPDRLGFGSWKDEYCYLI